MTQPGAGLEGAIWALPLPVPARASLLARLGILACEAEFPSLAIPRRLEAPCVPPCSFPACDLACLVCTLGLLGVYRPVRPH